MLKSKKTYKLVSVPSKLKKFIKVNKNGVVTVNKGLKKGTYKIKVQVTLNATANYQKTVVRGTVKITVK